MQKEKVKILIVEDEEDQRKRLMYVLNSEGYKVTEAESGDKAIKIVNNPEQTYNIVVTDLKMPGGNDGINVLREVKKASPSTEVLIVTAYGTVDNAVQAMINGAFDYIQKPLNMPELRIKIERALKNQEVLSELDSKEILKNNIEALSREIDAYQNKLFEIHEQSENLLTQLKKNDAGYNIIQNISNISNI